MPEPIKEKAYINTKTGDVVEKNKGKKSLEKLTDHRILIQDCDLQYGFATNEPRHGGCRMYSSLVWTDL